LPGVTALPVFDFAAFDAERRNRGLGWYEFAGELWQQSSELNAQRMDHPLCGGAVSRLGARGAASCQYALFMLRWLGRAPEDFLTGPVVDVSDVQLPEPGPGSRLRWDLNQLHTALNEQRQERGLTWPPLAQELGCTPSRLTNLRTARTAPLLTPKSDKYTWSGRSGRASTRMSAGLTSRCTSPAPCAASGAEATGETNSAAPARRQRALPLQYPPQVTAYREPHRDEQRPRRPRRPHRSG
jgi:hypothetical protein